MGFYYNIINCEVVILTEKMPQVSDGIRAYNGRLIEEWGATGSEVDETVDTPLLEQLARRNRWSVDSKPDADGNIVISSPSDETKGDDFCSWLSAIAIGVKDGSFVEVTNDDNHLYQYMFLSGVMYRVLPKWQIDADAEPC